MQVQTAEQKVYDMVYDALTIEAVCKKVGDVICDALIIGATCKNEENIIFLTKAGKEVDYLLQGLITKIIDLGEFKGKAGEILTIHTMEVLKVKELQANRVIVIGLGEQTKVDIQSIQRASAIAARHLHEKGAGNIALAIDLENDTVTKEQSLQAQIEGALLGLYTFRAYQTAEKEQQGITDIQILIDEAYEARAEQIIEKARILTEATNTARDLINEPSSVLTPKELVNRAVAMAEHTGLTYEILDCEKIQKLGMGGLIGVSQGSPQLPYFIILQYCGAPENPQTIGLVGKGITFDTGGLSLKPADRMDEMKGDMGGAAAVLGVMRAVANLKPHINVTALIPTCENMLSGTAYRPGDILRIMNGKTIEIINTDAEGRLILADALSYAVEKGLSPIIDLATLTGGMAITLGSVMAGLFCNNQGLTDEIIKAGERAGEKYWPMPLDDEYEELIKSDIADIRQTGGRYCSSITAAKILEHFVGNTQWAHLDIAATSYVDSKKPYQEKGGTGVGVRTLVELLLRRAEKNA
jgi:leucyl aminopeptidase